MSLLKWLLTVPDPERDQAEKAARRRVLERERLSHLAATERARLARQRDQAAEREAQKREREAQKRARKGKRTAPASPATTASPRRVAAPLKRLKVKARPGQPVKVTAARTAPAPRLVGRVSKRLKTRAAASITPASITPAASGPAVALTDAKTAAARLAKNNGRFQQSDLGAALGLAYPSQSLDQVTARLLASNFITAAGATGYRLTGNP